ncbi:hypothetical protein NXV57_16690 [Bacteroides thetaiotaomicron]|nr:hypothetical protein [Bacteroides thetaiotaomicron]
MSKDTKKKKSCRPLDEHQSERARKNDNRIDQAGGTIRCDKSRESYGANGCRNSF